MKKNITVYLSNISEDVWSFISTLSPPAFKIEVEENACLSDRALFTLSDNTIFISPKPVSGQFLDYFKQITGFKNINILVPHNADGQLSLDTAADVKIMDYLEQISLRYDGFNLLAYSATTEFYSLVSALESRRIKFNLSANPRPENSHTVDQFGSKSGIRTFIESLNNAKIFMSPGKIFSPGDDSFLDYAANLIKAGKGIVIKTNRGHAGMGILILPPDHINSTQNIPTQISELLKSETYWRQFPLIVEEFIDVNPQIGGGFPNVEYRIDVDGALIPLYPCGMRINKQGVFSGVEIGPNSVPTEMLKYMESIGQIIGSAYSREGYCGYFDIDFAAGRDGKLYITESNLRQTGGTHVYRLAKHILGPDFINNHYLIANNNYPLPSNKITFSEILSLFKDLIYNPVSKQGLIIASDNMLSFGRLSYVAIGPSKAQTQKIVDQMESLINSLSVTVS